MNSASWEALAPKTVVVIEQDMSGQRAKAVCPATVHSLPASIMAPTCLWLVSNNMNPYPVYPERTGEEDRPILPYSPV
jgi:hypothetical protein